MTRTRYAPATVAKRDAAIQARTDAVSRSIIAAHIAVGRPAPSDELARRAASYIVTTHDLGTATDMAFHDESREAYRVLLAYASALAEARDPSKRIARLETQAAEQDRWAENAEHEAQSREATVARLGPDHPNTPDDQERAEAERRRAQTCRAKAAAYRAEAAGVSTKQERAA